MSMPQAEKSTLFIVLEGAENMQIAYWQSDLPFANFSQSYHEGWTEIEIVSMPRGVWGASRSRRNTINNEACLRRVKSMLEHQ